jgi:Family of unknown function (DUF5723)
LPQAKSKNVYWYGTSMSRCEQSQLLYIQYAYTFGSASFHFFVSIILFMHTRFQFLIIFVALGHVFLGAQGLQGIRTERWAGISGVHLNPAKSITFPKKWDIQLGGAHFFGGTNYLYFINNKVGQVAKHPNNIRAVSDTLGNTESLLSPIFFDFPRSNQRWYGVIDTRIDGPSFSVKLKKRHTIGLFTAFRTLVSGYRVPPKLGYTNLDNLLWKVRQPVGKLSITGMAWGEVGAHYAYMASDWRGNNWGFGINVKTLNILQAGYANTNKAFEYMRVSRDTISLTNGDWDIGYNTDLVDKQTDLTSQDIHINGRGFSTDLGFSYLIPSFEGDTPQDYQWQFGASLTDFGYARIHKNAERHRFVFEDSVTTSIKNINQVTTTDQLVRGLSKTYLGDSSASLSGSRFTLTTPARINLQADYRALAHVYVHASWQQRLAFQPKSLRAPSFIAITPRFESRWFSAFLPLSLVDYRKIQYGAAMRLGVITIGTDHLASFLGQKRLQSTDFYVVVKVNAFTLLSKDKPLRKKDRTWSRVGCYNN